MQQNWEQRSIITANLLNPAFCGEVIRRTVINYNDNINGTKFPFSLTFFILPIVLHKKTREKMPRSIATYFHSWVQENENLFIDFAKRTSELLDYTKESLMFLYNKKQIEIIDSNIEVKNYEKINPKGEHSKEVIEIYKKAEMLGRWFRQTGNEQTIYMFLKLRP